MIKRPSAFKRFVFFGVFDIVLIVFSLFLSFFIHFDFNLNIDYIGLLKEAAAYFVIVKIAVFFLFRIYSMSWRYVSITDLFNVIIAMVFSELLLIVISLPKSYLPELSITRFSKRILSYAGGIFKPV